MSRRSSNNNRKQRNASVKPKGKTTKQRSRRHTNTRPAQHKSSPKAKTPQPDDVDNTDQTQESRLLLFNKPFMVLCQFTDAEERSTLANFIDIPHLYPAGRLDRDSEGLLLLTNDGMLQHRISHPDFKLTKRYLVQVEGDVSNKALQQLRDGVSLKDGFTAPAKAERVDEPTWLWERDPPIRFRKNNPTSWLTLDITEGKNRQVRRMTAAVGYPTLRLIRTHIGKHAVTGLAPGEHKDASGHFL